MKQQDREGLTVIGIKLEIWLIFSNMKHFKRSRIVSLSLLDLT